MDSWDVFVSYSRQDRDIVSPFVKLMGIGNEHIFKDIDIPLGKKWQVKIVEALENCKTVVVFWTCNAAGSQAVRKEYLTAIRRGIDVAPVRLDDTPLPKELREYEYADFRPYVHVKKAMSPLVWIIIILLAIAVAIAVTTCTHLWEQWLFLPLLGMVTSTTKSPRDRFEEDKALIHRMLYDRITRDVTGP